MTHLISRGLAASQKRRVNLHATLAGGTVASGRVRPRLLEQFPQ